MTYSYNSTKILNQLLQTVVKYCNELNNKKIEPCGQYEFRDVLFELMVLNL